MDTVAAAEGLFFDALRNGDGKALDSILTEDFLLVDVMRGGEVERRTFVDLVASGTLRFEAIVHESSRVRPHGRASISTGTTRMTMRLGPEVATAHSRYTHVFVKSAGEWRLASAQGTIIAP